MFCHAAVCTLRRDHGRSIQYLPYTEFSMLSHVNLISIEFKILKQDKYRTVTFL